VLRAGHLGRKTIKEEAMNKPRMMTLRAACELLERTHTRDDGQLGFIIISNDRPEEWELAAYNEAWNVLRGYIRSDPEVVTERQEWAEVEQYQEPGDEFPTPIVEQQPAPSPLALTGQHIAELEQAIRAEGFYILHNTGTGKFELSRVAPVGAIGTLATRA
jgi:hypothetical protein